jgi:hypothetical protein
MCKPRFQIRLSTLLLSVSMLAVVVAWLCDRHRLGETERQLRYEIQIQRQAVDSLITRFANNYSGDITHVQWNNADEYIAMLVGVSEERVFYAMTPSAVFGGIHILDALVDKLIVLLRDNNERTRWRALRSLYFIEMHARDVEAGKMPALLGNVVPLLNDPSMRIVGEAIRLLGLIGPPAADALVVLKQRAADDGDWYAPNAVMAIAAIDPSVNVGPRLTELLQMKHANWYQAAIAIPRYIDYETAKLALTNAYDRETDVTDREILLNLRNRLEHGDRDGSGANSPTTGLWGSGDESR